MDGRMTDRSMDGRMGGKKGGILKRGNETGKKEGKVL